MLIHEMTLQSICGCVHPKSVVFTGCGGTIDEWVIGVTKLWHKAEILRPHKKFHQVYCFFDGVKRNLVFNTIVPMMNYDKLDNWMTSNRIFKCAWLKDYARKKGIIVNE